MHVLSTFDVLKKTFFSSFFFICSNKQMPQATDFGRICNTEIFIQVSLCLIIHRISSGRQSPSFEHVAIFSVLLPCYIKLCIRMPLSENYFLSVLLLHASFT